MTTTNKARRWGVAGFVAAIGLVLASSPALATEISHSGKIGGHQLNDGPGNPGMICAYDDGTDDLVGFEEIRPPTIWSRDKTTGRDKQKVGWRFTIQRKRNNGAWKEFYKSSVMKANAWDDQSAFFLTVTPLNIMVPIDINPDHSSYRLRITQYWYKAGSVVGTALSQVDTIAEAYVQDSTPNPEYNELNTTCWNRFLH